jgi:phage tail sheath protein FI
MGTYLSPGIYTREVDFSFYVKQISTSSCGMVGVAQRGPVNKPVLVTSWEQFINKFGSYIQVGYLAYAARAFFDNGGSVLFVNRIAHLTDPTNRNTLTAVKAQAILKDRRVATATLASGTIGSDRIAWRAIQPGAAGNAVSVELVVAGNDTPLSVEVLGEAVIVNLATDGAGDPVSTADQVVAAVTGTPGAAALVTAETQDTGVVQAAAAANLSGGMDALDTLKVRAADEGTWGDRLSVQVEDGSLDPTGAFNLVVRHKGEVVEVFKDLSMDETAPNHVEIAVNERSDYITLEDLGTASGLPADRPVIGVFDLSGGDDGVTGLDDADYSGDPSQHTGFYAFDEIDALNLIMVPGVTTAEVIHAGVTYAENRQDLMLLAETPIHLEPLEAVDFRKGQGMYSHGAFNSSYAALYYPWIEINDPVTGKRKLIPPSGAVAGCYARSDKKAHVWYAPAGIDRGRIFNALSLGYKTSRGERDVLYPEGVNVIASFPDSGINIWGQKTLQSQPSALDRVNVRRLMMFIEEAIAESSRFVVFEPNNPQTWRALIRLINPFMQDIKDKGGLYDFAVQCDEETNTPAVIDRNELMARVFVKPTKTAEFIELNFVLTATGADFKEIFKTG